MADNTPVDPFKAFNIILNPDGTLTRGPHPLLPETIDPDPHQTVIYTDIPLNTTKNTYIRVYQPPILPSTPKLPLIIYFHGGGFIVFHVSSPHYHEPCIQMASEAPAIILAVEYALAPESRLPSAYEDALEAILWVQTEAFKAELEYKFFEHVDISKCFVMGSSAGANIVYHVGIQASNLELFKINGLIMNQPFISGVERTESELRLANDLVLPTCVNDLMWELSLPLGTDRDHEYCNPIKEDAHKKNADIHKKFPRCYIRGHGGDPALDRQNMFAKMLEEDGVCVVKDFTEDGFHGCELFDPNKARELIAVVKGFIYS
ncbi:hypothetical protein ACHQM5_013843 [Ranunculus cassubicifolius]